MVAALRLFLAVDLTETARRDLAHLLGRALADLIPGRPVVPPNWHFTLQFLGAVDAVAADRLRFSLDEIDLGGAFSIVFGGLDAFPRPSRANVLWLGVDRGGDALVSLQDRVAAAVGDAGLAIDERPFHAHVTLSRIRPPADVRSLLDSVAPVGVGMEVGRVTLFQSKMGRGGANYEAVDVFRLG